MSASDYGGGTPIVDVWRRDAGLALGHLESTPRLVSLPVKEQQGTACLEIHAGGKHLIAPGESFATLETFVAAHGGDYFATLDAYRRLMGERGLRAPQPPKESYEPIWCAWGYERNCTVQLIEDTLPKVKELGLSWAVIDDGWQSSVGDWNLNTGKFPGGETEMKRLVGRIKEQGLKPRLWIAPLAAAPGSDVLHDHTDMLLLDKDGAAQNVSWWNSFYLCPAYEPTVAYTLGVVRRILGDWGFAGLKIDGQHLNGVAPCFNPAHQHARPEESMEKLPEFFHAIYATAMQINPAAVIELCPCGTSYSFFDFPYINQAPASDPESSWQVRLKGKTLKALMGPSAPFAGDHVELSDHGDDFASTVGIGAVVSTKFTWPMDPKPKDSFLLTPEREREWRHWITLYNDKKLSQGIYRGELYDIGFDEPEAHVVQQSGTQLLLVLREAMAGCRGTARLTDRDLSGARLLQRPGSGPGVERAEHSEGGVRAFSADRGDTGVSGLLIEERRRRICDLLREHGRVTVDDLSRRFDTSVVTIRLDLAALEAAGALTRARGGALARREDDDLPIVVKQTLHHAEKTRIAKAAAALINDGETIVLDSGTTTAEIARQIRTLELKSINVITNALNIAMLLADVPAVRLIMLGGVLAPGVELFVRLHGRERHHSPAGRPAVPGRRWTRSGNRPHDAPPGRGAVEFENDPDLAAGRGRRGLIETTAPECLGDRQGGAVAYSDYRHGRADGRGGRASTSGCGRAIGLRGGARRGPVLLVRHRSLCSLRGVTQVTLHYSRKSYAYDQGLSLAQHRVERRNDAMGLSRGRLVLRIESRFPGWMWLGPRWNR